MGGGTYSGGIVESDSLLFSLLEVLCKDHPNSTLREIQIYYHNLCEPNKDFKKGDEPYLTTNKLDKYNLALVGSLNSRKSLEFTGLGLESIPRWIYDLPNLETVIFSDNQLTYIPEEVLKMENLIVNRNKLTFLPESMGDLESLVLIGNQITELPKKLCQEIKDSNKIIAIKDNPLIEFHNAYGYKHYLLNDEYIGEGRKLNLESVHKITDYEFYKEPYLKNLTNKEYITIKAYACNQEQVLELIEMGFDPMEVTVKLMNQYLLNPSDELEEFLSTLGTTKKLQNSELYNLNGLLTKITNRYKSLSERVNEKNPKNKEEYSIHL